MIGLLKQRQIIVNVFATQTNADHLECIRRVITDMGSIYVNAVQMSQRSSLFMNTTNAEKMDFILLNSESDIYEQEVAFWNMVLLGGERGTIVHLHRKTDNVVRDIFKECNKGVEQLLIVSENQLRVDTFKGDNDDDDDDDDTLKDIWFIKQSSNCNVKKIKHSLKFAKRRLFLKPDFLANLKKLMTRQKRDLLLISHPLENSRTVNWTNVKKEVEKFKEWNNVNVIQFFYNLSTTTAGVIEGADDFGCDVSASDRAEALSAIMANNEQELNLHKHAAAVASCFEKVRIFNAIFHARVINSFFLQGKIVRMGGNENSVEYRC
jgi:hypothetical protein